MAFTSVLLRKKIAISMDGRGAWRDNVDAKFFSVHASFHNHFNSERHLGDRQTYKIRRSTALAEWQSLSA